MATVQDHYARLLARHYGRMAGDFEAKVDADAALLETLGAGDCLPRTALDLGAGPGYQSAVLARLGFQVTAVDTSPELLAELRNRLRGGPVVTVEADLVEFVASYPDPVGMIVCMGDTLTHLESRDRVRELADAAYRALAPSGLFVVTFRDLSAALSDEERFIPVVSEGDLLMTCFLEFEPETVKVHDLVHSREADGEWRFDCSCYRKLRLEPEWVTGTLEAAGFEVARSDLPSGMVVLAGRLPL